jgi:hypothetical protein
MASFASWVRPGGVGCGLPVPSVATLRMRPGESQGVSWTARRSIADAFRDKKAYCIHHCAYERVHAAFGMVSDSMRCPGVTHPEQQQGVEEADFDLDLVQRRIENLRSSLHEACQDSHSVCLRLSRLGTETETSRDVRARAQEMLAACRSACIHLDLPIDRR